MRILAGEARGRLLETPRGLSTRPTSARMRGAIFDRLGSSVVGCTVLDLFAGTGSLGLEALSRGAARATFVESAAPAVRVLRKNVASLGYSERAQVLAVPVSRAWSGLRGQQFDLVLMDAPYGKGELEPALDELVRREHVRPEGTIITVHGVREASPLPPAGWSPIDHRSYGDSAVTTYRHVAGSHSPPPGPGGDEGQNG